MRAASPAQPAELPGDALLRRVKDLKERVRTCDELARTPILPAFANRNVLPSLLGPEKPAAALDGDRWSVQSYGLELPVVWVSDLPEPRFQIMREQFEKSTDAVVNYAWYFLRAYSKLRPELRKANSTLAMGAAALVAAEIVYPQSYVCLPVELQDAAAIVAVLELESPGLLRGCFEGGAFSLEALDAAISRMCTVDGQGDSGPGAKASGPRQVSKPVHREGAALAQKPINQAFEDAPVQIGAFLPPHPQSLQTLLMIVEGEKGLRHLELRGLLIAVSAPERFGLPELSAAAAAEWRKELDRLLAQTRAEKKLREESFKEPVFLAPAYQAGKPRLQLIDPGVLRPLLILAAGAAAPQLKAARERGPNAYLEKLRTLEPTRLVLELAGSDPFVELPAGEAAGKIGVRPPGAPGPTGAATNISAELTWDTLVRSKLEPGRPVLTESLKMRLIEYVPLGSAKPICGVGTSVWMSVRDTVDGPNNGRIRRIRAVDVQPGMRVFGYRNVGSAETKTTVRLDPAEQRPAWFTVMEREVHPRVPRTLALGFRHGSDPVQEIVFSLAHHVLIGVSAKQASWRRTIDVDPTARPWPFMEAGSQAPMGTADVEWLRQQYQDQDLIEFSLSSEEVRGVANNLLVSSAEQGGVSILAEARPLDAGYIDATDTITMADGTVRTLGELIANPAVWPDKNASVVAGYYVKPPADKWPYPEITKHEGYVLKKTTARVPKMIELVFEDGSAVHLGPGNWMLTWDGHHSSEVRAEKLQPGAAVVADLDAAGNPRLMKVKAVNTSEKPERDFVLLELTNLPYAQIGAVLVGVDFRPWHETNQGLAEHTEIAIPADPGVPVKIATKGMEVRAQELAGKPVVNFDIALDTLTQGSIAGGRQDGVTQMLEITAQSAKENRTITCGAGQYFPVYMGGGGRVEFEQARNLSPGMGLCVVDPATGRTEHWKIHCVTPRFHALRPLVALSAGQRQQWHGKAATEIDVCFGNAIAFLLEIRGKGRGGRARSEIPGQDGIGEGSGGHNGPYIGGRQSFDVRAGYMPERPPVDVVAIPPDAIEPLRARGHDLIERFASEGHGVRAPGANNAALRPWLSALSTPDQPWPVADTRLALQLAAWLGDVVKRRSGFLDSCDPQLLPGLLFSEGFVATWMQESGAESTAALLVQDLVELSVYAGCETGTNKDKQRLSGQFQLPLMLSLPAHIIHRDQGDPGKSDIRQVLASYALHTASNWAATRKLSTDIVSNKDISLRDLYAYWSRTAPDRFDPFWSYIREPNSQAGKSFNDWLAQRGSKLVLPRRAPDASAEPAPPEIDERSLLTDPQKPAGGDATQPAANPL